MGTIFYKDKMYSGGGGSNVRELSKSAYNALSAYEKNNGTLYLVNGRMGVTDQITNITIDKYLENSSVCTDTVSQDGTSVVSEWLGGGQIGNNFWFVDKIDVTIYDHISYDLDLGTCYGTSATWNYTVGLMSAIPNTWWYANNTTDYVVKKTHDTVETTYTDQQLDVSNLTGEYYIAVVAHGWNATLSNIRLVTVNSLPNDIYYKGTQFSELSVYPHITYGTAEPTNPGLDGDLYILLNSNNKKQAEYLYMGNQWVLIYGRVIGCEVVLSQSRQNSTTNDTYTATESCVVFAINQNMNGEASTKTLTSTITTTGTIIDSDEYSANYSQPDRNQTTKVALIQLSEGDTVTLGNTTDGSFTTQSHVVLKLDRINASTITRKVIEAEADNSISTTQSFTTIGGINIATVFETSGSGSGVSIVSLNTSTPIDGLIMDDVINNTTARMSIGLVLHPNTINFNWGNVSSYATKGYAVYQLS